MDRPLSWIRPAVWAMPAMPPRVMDDIRNGSIRRFGIAPDVVMILLPFVTSKMVDSVSFMYSGRHEASARLENMAKIIMYAPSLRRVSAAYVIALSRRLIMLIFSFTGIAQHDMSLLLTFMVSCVR